MRQYTLRADHLRGLAAKTSNQDTVLDHQQRDGESPGML
jgi:hypothetical protein